MVKIFFLRSLLYTVYITLGLLLLSFWAQAQTGLYYRSTASGNWNTPACWQVSNNATFSSTAAAASAPDHTSNTVTIQDGHTITIIANVTIDEVVVDFGGTLIFSNTSLLNVTLANGNGIDLHVNGTLEDHMSASVNWGNDAKWSAGTQSAFVKTSSSAVTTWQTNYANGIATLPATHQWIYRKQTSDNPSVTIAGAVYGNLSFDNVTTSLWDATSVSSRLTGSSSSCIIKGKMTIGDQCKIYLENSASVPLLVQGDFEVKTLGTFVFNTSLSGGARGLDLQGNLTVNGSLLYDLSFATDLNRLIQFSGTNDQVISSPATLSLYNMVVDKLSGKVTLSANVTVTNILTLTSGIIKLNAHTLHLSNGNASALVVAAGGLYAEDVFFLGKFSRVIGQSGMPYLFPFTNTFWTVGFSIVSPLTVSNEIVSASTYKTATDNLPLPYLNGMPLNSPNGVASDVGNDTGDRYWVIDAPGTFSATSLTITFWPLFELNTLVPLWDIIQNKPGANWEYISLNNSGHIFTAPLVTDIRGVWTVIAHNIALGFKPLSNNDSIAKNIPNEIVDIDVYSSEGKWLKSFTASLVIEVRTQLSTGLYFLRIMHQDKAETLKIGVE